MDTIDDALFVSSTGLGPDIAAALPRTEDMPRAAVGPGLNVEAILTDSVSRFIAFKQNLETVNAVQRMEEQMKTLQDEITSQVNTFQQDMDDKIQSYQQETSLKIESDQKVTSATLHEFELRLGQMDDSIRELRDSDAVSTLKSEIDSLRDDLKDAKQEIGLAFEDRWGEIRNEVGSISNITEELQDQLQTLSAQPHQSSPTFQGYSDLPVLRIRDSMDIRDSPEPHEPERKKQKRVLSLQKTDPVGYPESSLRRKGQLPVDELGRVEIDHASLTSEISAEFATSPEARFVASPPTNKPRRATKPKKASHVPTPAFYTEEADEIRHTVIEYVKKYAKNTPKSTKSEQTFIWRFFDSIADDWSMFIQQELLEAYPHIVKPNPRGRPTHIIQLRGLTWMNVRGWFKEHRAMFKSNEESDTIIVRGGRGSTGRH